MAREVILPKQGQSVETCLILGWKKKVGEEVREGEPLVEGETDKASFEIPSPFSGTLLAILHREGEDVPVLSPLALIGQAGEAAAAVPEAASTAEPRTPAAAAPAPSAAPSAPQSVGASSRKGGRLPISPRARRLAERAGVEPAAAASGLPGGRGSGPGGRILERDMRRALELRGAAAAPAAAAARAAAGPREAAPAATRPAAPAPIGAAADFPGPVTEVPVAGVRKVIAARMLASISGTAQYTTHAWANAEILTAYRQRLKASPEELGLRAITIGDMVNFAAARTLASHPEVNAHFKDGRVLQFQRVHLAFAVDTPRGLLVPVIRDADRLPLKRLSAEAARLAQACQQGSIALDELAGGTFTVSNLGALGVEFFTPILNPPQLAILGVGGISLRPVPSESEPGGVAFKPHIALSLTANHQVLDGAPAARFLAELGRNIENFGLLLALG